MVEINFNILDIDDIYKYNPYENLSQFRNSEYFEQVFLEYFRVFSREVEKLKERLKHNRDRQIDRIFKSVIKLRNNQEIDRILASYSSSFSENEENVLKLKFDIRLVKDMILASEEPDMKRLHKVDDLTSQVIDRQSEILGVVISKRYSGGTIDEILMRYQSIRKENFKIATESLKNMVTSICEDYRRNYSVKTASKYIRGLNNKVNKLICDKARELGVLSDDINLIDDLVNRYVNVGVKFDNYEEFIDAFRKEIDSLKREFDIKYSEDLARKLITLLDKKTGVLIDKVAKNVGYPLEHEKRLQIIFDAYQPEKLDIFDSKLYSSEGERTLAIQKYKFMTDDEKKVFEMRKYEEYIRIFKRKIREFNSDIRRIYSLEYADGMIASINKRADELISSKAKKIGKPVSKNPWLVRRYLWADTNNFMSLHGLKFRKMINPILKRVVKVAMDNKLIIEERTSLDPTKPYIFVSTHYFTEDVIGLFSSIERQAYMLMGTTDQIENNPLMLAAVLFGFFHVDRMDAVNRKESFEKQNNIIENGASFINYVGGSWENSENELQPLSFSGPYRTSVLKNVQIVPVASYLVREEKKMYVRFGEPLDLSKCSEEEGNEVIRDTLASMHFKQLDKYSVPIGSIDIKGYGMVHDLPYDQHTYYMDQVGNEYWHQPWSKPFALEEIGLRHRKDVSLEDVYGFVDNLSREKLIELSSILSEPLVRRYEKERYDIISYIDENYERFRRNNSKKKIKEKK